MSTMADIIAAHKYDHEGAVCSCSNEVQVGLRCDSQTHAEHVAAELAAAGYGNMADAWDEGVNTGRRYPSDAKARNPYPRSHP